MKIGKTFVVEFKSGRIDKIFAWDLKDLETRCNFELVVKYKEIISL